MTRQINTEGLAMIEAREGERNVAYRDGGGVLTIGYGHTRGVTEGMTSTHEQNEAWLREDLAESESTVENDVTVDLNDDQFAALVDFVYNVGAGNFESSTLLKRINANDFAAVPGELNKWTHDRAGNVEPGLVSRRAAEGELFMRATPQMVSVHPSDTNPPSISQKILTPESVAMTMPAVTSLASAANNPGPLQWAIAIVLVLVAIAGIYYFVFKNRK